MKQSKRVKLALVLSFVLSILSVTYSLPRADCTTFSITSRLSIATFWTDFVSINWNLQVNSSDPNDRMIMIIPGDVINESLVNGTFVEISKAYDSKADSMVFSLESPLPLGVISSDFPNDRYEANYIVGCNFLSQNSSVHLGGLIPVGSTDNYLAEWSLDSYPGFASKIQELPSFVYSDIGNIASWYRLNLIIFHRPSFSEFVIPLVNLLPFLLCVLGGVVVVTIFAPILIDGYRSKSRQSKRATLIEEIAVPVTIAVLVFIPIFLLAIHPFEAPLMLTSVENRLVTPLYLYIGILIAAAMLRALFSTPEK